MLRGLKKNEGAGDSGKSTVLKQMRLLYAHGFSRSEREEWRAIIFNNAMAALKQILDTMDELKIELKDRHNAVNFCPICCLSLAP
jgi:guanine nucleotide-binding protein subunit alpha